MKYLCVIILGWLTFTHANGQTLDTSIEFSDTITITEKPYQSGDLTMTQNQYKVMPASFQDPARILIKYPGFSTPNDGANAIVFRGFAPETARWQLFGADIVNPNHLSNAGTTNDQSAATAGGVNALSGSVLDYYHFEANPSDISYCNVLSGVSNMKMAPKIKSFLDINLIGLEAGINLSNTQKPSPYLNNVYLSYRYSFVGFLNKLGIDFGNEKIGYQDLSAYADIFKDNNKSLKTFFTIGNSSNLFSAVSRGDSITRFKDIQNITFCSSLGIGGVQFTHKKDQRVFLTTLVSSFTKNERIEYTEKIFADSLNMNFNKANYQREHMLSSHTTYIMHGKTTVTTFGLRLNHSTNSGISLVKNVIDPVASIYPYTKFNKSVGDKLSYSIGLGAFFDSLTDEWTAEPSLVTKYKLSEKSKVEFDYRLSSIQNFTSLENVNWGQKPNRPKAHNLQMSFQHQSQKCQIRASWFYHFVYDLNNFSSNITNGLKHFSVFNGGNLGYDQFFPNSFFTTAGLANARVYGGDIYLENRADMGSNSLFYSANASVFDSQYSLPESKNEFYDAKYNYGYTANIFISFEKDLSVKNTSRQLTIGLSTHMRGSQRVQETFSVPDLTSGSIYNPNSGFVQSLRPYQRLDFRVVYTKQKNGSNKTQRWSLDIQNLSNRENDGFRYYDPLLKSVFLQKQLGLIPVLSYRLEW